LKPVECPTFCNRMLDPVCGSNYQTYGNECVLRNEHCYKDEKLTQLHTGPCECPSLCPATINLVCGSDGKTYTSACHLARSRCGGGETEAVNVEFEHWGECEQNGDLQAELVVSPEVNLKFGRPKLDNGWRPSWAPKPTTTQAPAPFCPRIWIPVCDENGKTHGHPCYPNHYGLKWEYGECKPVMVNDNVIITTTEAPETEAPAAYIPKQDCPCHRAFRPVCGSNGNTYANECSNQFVQLVVKNSLMTVLLSAPVKKSSLSAVVTLSIMANALTWLMTFLAGLALALGALSTKWKMMLSKKWSLKLY